LLDWFCILTLQYAGKIVKWPVVWAGKSIIISRIVVGL
jgi:hypothetical protein